MFSKKKRKKNRHRKKQRRHLVLFVRGACVCVRMAARFLVNFEKTLMEREVPHDDRHEQSDDSTATSPDHVKLGFVAAFIYKKRH